MHVWKLGETQARLLTIVLGHGYMSLSDMVRDIDINRITSCVQLRVHVFLETIFFLVENITDQVCAGLCSLALCTAPRAILLMKGHEGTREIYLSHMGIGGWVVGCFSLTDLQTEIPGGSLF